MALKTYDREAAVAYAKTWALLRNPKYYDYDGIGGDCTNFVSQCLYAGSSVMNFKETFGWYYISASNHSPSWTGVVYLYNYLTRKTGPGPVGVEVPMQKVMPGDISQFADVVPRFSHSQFIVSIKDVPSLENVLVCTHTFDSIDRPLSTYSFQKIRFIHITGVRK
ncbi:MAG: amidase domain-containing protein [Christensenellales bacterium]|jgi:hypothetical protein